MNTNEEVACPKCGGRTWDNRLSKRNPAAPDYKCRDKGCDGAVWPPRNGAPPVQQRASQAAPQPYSTPVPRANAAPATPARQGYDTPPVLPGEFRDDGLADLMRQCIADAAQAWHAATRDDDAITYTSDNVQGAASTLFIARKERMGQAA